MIIKELKFVDVEKTTGGTVEFDLRNRAISHILIKHLNATSSPVHSLKIEFHKEDGSEFITPELSSVVAGVYSDIEFKKLSVANTVQYALPVGMIHLSGAEAIKVKITDESSSGESTFTVTTVNYDSNLDFMYNYKDVNYKSSGLPVVDAVLLELGSAADDDKLEYWINGKYNIVDIATIKEVSKLYKEYDIPVGYVLLYVGEEVINFRYEIKTDATDVHFHYRTVTADANRNKSVFNKKAAEARQEEQEIEDVTKPSELAGLVSVGKVYNTKVKEITSKIKKSL